MYTFTKLYAQGRANTLLRMVSKSQLLLIWVKISLIFFTLQRDGCPFFFYYISVIKNFYNISIFGAFCPY